MEESRVLIDRGIHGYIEQVLENDAKITGKETAEQGAARWHLFDLQMNTGTVQFFPPDQQHVVNSLSQIRREVILDRPEQREHLFLNAGNDEADVGSLFANRIPVQPRAHETVDGVERLSQGRFDLSDEVFAKAGGTGEAQYLQQSGIIAPLETLVAADDASSGFRDVALGRAERVEPPGEPTQSGCERETVRTLLAQKIVQMAYPVVIAFHGEAVNALTPRLALDQNQPANSTDQRTHNTDVQNLIHEYFRDVTSKTTRILEV